MFNSKERKLERLNSGLKDAISAHTYNLAIGAFILYGIVMNMLIVAFCSDFFMTMDYRIFIIGYFVLCLAGIFMSTSKNPIMSFAGYNLVVVPIGAVLSVCLPAYSISHILSAIVVTALICAIMMCISTAFPNAFAKMGLTLFIALLTAVIVEGLAMFFGYGGGVFNWIYVVIFTLYIGYDWHKAQVYPKTLDNAIDSALDIYLDIINLFLRLLEIMSKNKNRR